MPLRWLAAPLPSAQRVPLLLALILPPAHVFGGRRNDPSGEAGEEHNVLLPLLLLRCLSKTWKTLLSPVVWDLPMVGNAGVLAPLLSKERPMSREGSKENPEIVVGVAPVSAVL